MKSQEKNFLPLPNSFFLRDTRTVAKNLLGKGLYLKSGKTVLLAEIVEVEAYLGSGDPASHAFRGITKRNWPMFEEGGMCYVYLSYGINFCMNVVTREKGIGEAVLLRAAIPLLGIKKIKKNRGKLFDNRSNAIKNLLSGPGKLTQGFGIDLRHNGLTYDRENFKLVDLRRDPLKSIIASSTRIGISKAKDSPYRYFISGSNWLSKKEK